MSRVIPRLVTPSDLSDDDHYAKLQDFRYEDTRDPSPPRPPFRMLGIPFSGLLHLGGNQPALRLESQVLMSTILNEDDEELPPDTHALGRRYEMARIHVMVRVVVPDPGDFELSFQLPSPAAFVSDQSNATRADVSLAKLGESVFELLFVTLNTQPDFDLIMVLKDKRARKSAKFTLCTVNLRALLSNNPVPSYSVSRLPTGFACSYGFPEDADYAITRDFKYVDTSSALEATLISGALTWGGTEVLRLSSVRPYFEVKNAATGKYHAKTDASDGMAVYARLAVPLAIDVLHPGNFEVLLKLPRTALFSDQEPFTTATILLQGKGVVRLTLHLHVLAEFAAFDVSVRFQDRSTKRFAHLPSITIDPKRF